MVFDWKSTKIFAALAGLKAGRIQDIQNTKKCHQEDGLFFVANDPFHPPSYLKSHVLHWSSLAQQGLKTNVAKVLTGLFEYTAMGIIQS